MAVALDTRHLLNHPLCAGTLTALQPSPANVAFAALLAVAAISPGIRRTAFGVASGDAGTDCASSTDDRAVGAAVESLEPLDPLPVVIARLAPDTVIERVGEELQVRGPAGRSVLAATGVEPAPCLVLSSRWLRPPAELRRYVRLDTTSVAQARDLARRLRQIPGVEIAYLQGRGRPAGDTKPAASPLPACNPPAANGIPDFSCFQSYLGPSSHAGLGILDVRDLPGSRGEGVRIVDIEYSWNLDHLDLPFSSQPLFLDRRGCDPIPQDRGNHGTAAIGVLAASENDFGIGGISPLASFGVVSPAQPRGSDCSYDLPSAILAAADALGPGDIIQIELESSPIQLGGVSASLPVEWEPLVFDTIKAVVARGIIVVEPAGNGAISLDRAELGGAFNRKKRDSGAIIVGAGFANDRYRISISNYGSRVDVQAQGITVCTLGYGDMWGSDAIDKYTYAFLGTSAATPCVAGTIAVLQGLVRAAGLPPLDPPLLRQVLAGTGRPDDSGKKAIGPRPDVAEAFLAVGDPATPYVTGVKYQGKKDRLVIDGLYFAGADATPEMRSVARIERLDGTIIPLPTAYPDGFTRPDGTTTRVVTASGVAKLVPVGELVFVTVTRPGVEPGTETVSPRRALVRK
jgi:hypothetical protein